MALAAWCIGESTFGEKPTICSYAIGHWPLGVLLAPGQFAIRTWGVQYLSAISHSHKVIVVVFGQLATGTRELYSFLGDWPCAHRNFSRVWAIGDGHMGTLKLFGRSAMCTWEL